MGVEAASIHRCNHEAGNQEKAFECQKTTRMGHTYRKISQGFKVFSEMMTIPHSLQYQVQCCMGLATIFTGGSVFRSASQLAEVSTYIDTIRTFDDIRYFTSFEFLSDLAEGYFPGAISGTLFLSSSLGGCAGVASAFRILDLDSISAALGRVQFCGTFPFQALTRLGLSQFCILTATGAYFTGAIDCLMKIHAGDLSKGRLALLAYNVASCVSNLFLLMAGALLNSSLGMATAGTLAVIAGSCGAWSIYQGELDSRAQLTAKTA